MKKPNGLWRGLSGLFVLLFTVHYLDYHLRGDEEAPAFV